MIPTTPISVLRMPNTPTAKMNMRSLLLPFTMIDSPLNRYANENVTSTAPSPRNAHIWSAVAPSTCASLVKFQELEP